MVLLSNSQLKGPGFDSPMSTARRLLRLLNDLYSGSLSAAQELKHQLHNLIISQLSVLTSNRGRTNNPSAVTVLDKLKQIPTDLRLSVCPVDKRIDRYFIDPQGEFKVPVA